MILIDAQIATIVYFAIRVIFANFVIEALISIFACNANYVAIA